MESFINEMKQRAGLLEGPRGSEQERVYVIEHHTSSGAPFVEEAADWKIGEAIETLLDKAPLKQGQYVVIRLPGPDGR